MYPRTNYEMTEADLKTILEACRPTPAIWGSGGAPMFGTPQENANRAWAELGKRMGFDSMTVEPVRGKGDRFFTAVPNETEAQRQAREAAEATDRRNSEIATITLEIAERKKRLAELGATT